MSGKAQPGDVKSQPVAGSKVGWVPWVVLSLVVLSLFLMTPAGVRVLRKGRAALAPLLPKPSAPQGSAPLDLVIATTNDTWGYLVPCG